MRRSDGAGMVGLGFLSKATLYQRSNAEGVSADGSVVVGYSKNADGANEAFRWTSGGGMVGAVIRFENMMRTRSRRSVTPCKPAVLPPDAARVARF